MDGERRYEIMTDHERLLFKLRKISEEEARLKKSKEENFDMQLLFREAGDEVGLQICVKAYIAIGKQLGRYHKLYSHVNSRLRKLENDYHTKTRKGGPSHE